MGGRRFAARRQEVSGMVAQSSIGTGVFGPFGNMFEAYFTGLQSLSRGFAMQPADAQALGSQVTGPVKALARCQLEVMGFVNRRAQAQMELPQRLSRCRTPQDFMAEQVNFWHTAWEQYSESTQRIMEASSQVFAQGFNGSGQGVRREHDYIAFPETRDGGEAVPPSLAVRERQRRVA
jgi:hypothetical protein